MSVGLTRKDLPPSTLALLAHLFASAGQSMLIYMSRVNGGFAYDASSVVCLQEGFKLLLAITNEVNEIRSRPRASQCGDWCAANLLPGFMAALHSNLVFLAHLYVSPPMFHLLSLCRVSVTGVLFRFVFQQELSVLQWISLVQLSLAIAGTCHIDAHSAADRTSEPDADWLTVMSLMLILAACSSLSSAHLLLRNQTHDPHLHLSAFLSSLMLYATLGTKRPLEGYNLPVYLLIITNSLMGAVLGRKPPLGFQLLGTVGSLMLAIGLSWLLSDFNGGGNFWRATLLSISALGLYYGDPKALYRSDAELMPFGRRHARQELPKMV